MEGTPFGRYRLLELLGRGGMGEVWRAWDTAIDRAVALKMLLPRYAKDPEYERRFRREAHAAARLDDPHVVPIYDIGEIEGRLYVTMRLVKGSDLQTTLDTSGPLPPTRIVPIVEQIASALNSAHRIGLVHRDVKPPNILLTATDYAYLIDFGIARAADNSALTAVDTKLGTWAYMSPERFNSGGEVGPAADVYALACVLYQGLTGNLPFPGDTFEQIAVSHMMMPPPRPSEERDGIPSALDGVIATGLAKQPADRYSTATELARAAAAAIAGMAPADPNTPQSSRPPPAGADHTLPWVVATPRDGPVASRPEPNRRLFAVVGAAVVVAILVAAGVYAVTRPSSEAPVPVTNPTAAPSPLGTPLDTGPFTGLFRAEFEPPGAAAVEYAIRSACRPAGCVATATRWTDDATLAANPVFDEVGNLWRSLELTDGICEYTRGDMWQTLHLRPRPDGTITGELTSATDEGCIETRSVTMTRVRDLAPDDRLPVDPATLPARVPSPAETLHGRYQMVRSFAAPSIPEFRADGTVTTDCLRGGDRCMSYFSSPSGDAALVFGDGAWTWSEKSAAPCVGGEPSQLSASARFPLPDPLLNPLFSLTGQGTWVRTGGCPLTTTFDQMLTRTGE